MRKADHVGRSIVLQVVTGTHFGYITGYCGRRFFYVKYVYGGMFGESF